MLTLIVPGEEHYDEKDNTFFTVGDTVLHLEHSLVSLSKWESKHRIPFLGEKDKTPEQTMDYIRCMILDPVYDPEVLYALSQENLNDINSYVETQQTATTFGNLPQPRGRGETITSELIYYWLVAFQIPFEVETWHLSRLFTLIRVCNVKQQKPKKMSRSEIARRNAELNAKRLEQFGTSG